jgi:1,4-dihydroxy-2-naphthoate polyprenyltransferase
VLYGLGAAMAVIGGATLDWGRFAWGQLVVTATQLGTHYSNDYFDLEADRANQTPTRWSGGSRVLPAGMLPPGVALAASVVLFGLATVAGVWLSARAGRTALLLPLGLAMIGLAWQYSSPPLRLVASGLGEVTTAIVVTLLVPVYAYALQTGELRPPILFAALLPCALQFAMLLAIEFPDAGGDAAAGKRTLVVRLGAAPAARLYAVTTLAGFGLLPLLARPGLPAAVVVAPMLLAPLAIWQTMRVARGAYRDSARWESVAFWSVALLIGSAVAELIAALLVIRGG